MNKIIPYTKHSIDSDDVAAVGSALMGGSVTGGSKIAEFESAIAAFCGARYCVVCSNGTAALHIANLAAGFAPGSKIVAPAVTFAATVNSILYVGGNPLLCDIDPITVQISVPYLMDLIEKNENVRGVIPVHMGEVIGDCEKLKEVADRNNLIVIEDACHSYGGKWTDSRGIRRTVGDCSYSDMAVFSFHPAKLICTGEGGAVTTNDQSLYERMISIRSHGIERDPTRLHSLDGGWYYEVQQLGFNYRLTEFQAALGLSQLKKAAGWIKRRKVLVDRYDAAFRGLRQIKPQMHPQDMDLAYHLYIVAAVSRRELYDSLRANNINAQVHYVPIHYHPFFQSRLKVSVGDFPNAEAYYEKAISLPLYSDLSDFDQDRVIKEVFDFYRGSVA